MTAAKSGTVKSAPNDVLGPRPPKKERGAEATKGRIVTAAIAEFSAKGFDGARLSAIARAADVQAALIHHYFVDKEGLFRAALQRALEPMSAEVWSVLGAFNAQLEAARAAQRRLSGDELHAMTAGFVALVEHLFQTHGALLSMLRHEAERDGAAVKDLIGQLLRPLFDGAVQHLEEMQRREELARGFDARQLCLFVMGTVGFFSTDTALVEGLWPVAHDATDRRAARQSELVAMILARVAPPA